MRREGTPAWMQVVERRLEQVAEEVRSRPAKAGIPHCRDLCTRLQGCRVFDALSRAVAERRLEQAAEVGTGDARGVRLQGGRW